MPSSSRGIFDPSRRPAVEDRVPVCERATRAVDGHPPERASRKPERAFGVTRSVWLTRRWAIKVPSRYGWGVRGWLANQSEWHQRRDPAVVAAVFTFAHVVAVYPRAARIGSADEPGPWDHAPPGDEAKPSSWGWYPSAHTSRGTWRLVDYDRCWAQPRTVVAALYFGRQERMARRWLALDPSATVVQDQDT